MVKLQDRSAWEGVIHEVATRESAASSNCGLSKCEAGPLRESVPGGHGSKTRSEEEPLRQTSAEGSIDCDRALDFNGQICRVQGICLSGAF